MRETREERKKNGSRLGGKCGVKSGTRGIDESKKSDDETSRSGENP